MMAKPKKESNPARWARLVDEARSAFDDLQSNIDACKSALEELDGMREEYEEKEGNLTDNLRATPYGEKLEAMTSLDLQSAISALDELDGIDSAISEAEEIEVPLGFGRD